MTAIVLWAAGILTAVIGIRYVLRWAGRWAARHLEDLLAEALEHDYLADIDDEYQQLLEEDA